MTSRNGGVCTKCRKSVPARRLVATRLGPRCTRCLDRLPPGRRRAVLRTTPATDDK